MSMLLFRCCFRLIHSSLSLSPVKAVKISETGRPKDVSERIYKHMAEMTVLVTQLVVEFAKCLPGFSDLDREDQIVLLKASVT